MIGSERRDAILRELRLRGTVNVVEFAARLSVSAVTLRRDLRELEAEGQLTRVHGGARYVQHAASEAPAVEQKLAATFGLVPRRRGDDVPLATIGMIAPTSSYYYAEAIEGAKEAARLAGVRLMLAISEYNQVEELRILERMIALDIDGILITPSKSTLVGSKIKEAIEQAPLPVTVLERIWEFPTAGATVDCVRSDHRHGAELAVAHLAELGHRRIAVWTFDNPHEDEIKDGFEEAALRAGCELVHPSFDYGHPDWDSIDLLENARRYLAGLRDGGATAVLVHPDRVALHVVQAAAEAGLRIPEDLSVVAYDDEVAGLAERPLTAIAPPKKAIGFAAIDACLRSIAHGAAPTGPFPAQRIRLLPHLNVRESTSAPAR